ncbi:RrF2 family transcriptional regulator [Sphingomonas elodea]|uniref:RrF2 family transcriptional regulator n=1 Tax=Sphingomonas elodea TaxID=179878 RepID=UPI0002630D1A|nr:Rrf2 family transcriptional regulator [Sphingomonas elodea]
MLSQRARYAVKAMLNIARTPESASQVRSISDEEGIPRRFLEVIMVDLRRAGLVESARGKTGGYRLARPASLISFAEILRTIDGPLALLPCASRNFYARCADCPDTVHCALSLVLAEARDRMASVLEGTTLADADALDRRFQLLREVA